METRLIRACLREERERATTICREPRFAVCLKACFPAVLLPFLCEDCEPEAAPATKISATANGMNWFRIDETRRLIIVRAYLEQCGQVRSRPQASKDRGATGKLIVLESASPVKANGILTELNLCSRPTAVDRNDRPIDKFGFFSA